MIDKEPLPPPLDPGLIVERGQIVPPPPPPPRKVEAGQIVPPPPPPPKTTTKPKK